MIVGTTQGDLVQTMYQKSIIMAHGCNCFCTMGSGIAGQLSEHFPEVYQADLNEGRRGDITKLGEFTVAAPNTSVVFNLYTQYRYGQGERQVDYAAIKYAVKSMCNYIRENDMLGIVGVDCIHVPLIGAGLAGGDWELIREIIDVMSEDIPVVVVEFKLNYILDL